MNYTLHHGDCLKVLQELPDSSVDSIVTDPPYGLSFMGKKWDYDVPSQEVWAECLRVLKPGGHLLAFAGTRTQHRMAVRIEDAGFEIRDMIAWVYGSGFPKSHNLKDEWEGWGTALKPALEPITVARKPLVGTVAENVLQYGTGGLNIDGCRVGFVSEADRKESTAKNQHADFGTQPMTNNNVYGDYSMIQPANYNPPGRWPANLIHDGSEEVVGLFPKTGGGSYSKSGGRNLDGPSRAFGSFDQSVKNAPDNYGDSGSAARFFYCAKASKADRDEGLEGFEDKLFGQSGGAQQALKEGKTEYQTGENVSTGLNTIKIRKNNHPTVKPTDLMRYLCRLVTPPNGTVLDPFMGSGSTGKAAVLEGVNFIGIERESEYIAISKSRIENADKSKRKGQLELFENVV